MQSNTIKCCQCGTHFTMSTAVEDLRRADGEIFYCPNGHAQHWAKKPTATEKRIRVLEESRRQWIKTCVDLREEVRELKKEECPVCGEMFTSVNCHMAKMHPEQWSAKVQLRKDQKLLDSMQNVN